MSYKDNYYSDSYRYDTYMRDEGAYSYDCPPRYNWYDNYLPWQNDDYINYDSPSFYEPPLQCMPVKKPVKNSHLYKTELCSQWLAKGSCPYNHRCRFAHGPKELRPVTRDANYRSKPCRKFKSQGWCPYGARCTFIHDPRDVRSFLKNTKLNLDRTPAGKDPLPAEAPKENDTTKENCKSRKSISAKLEMTRKLQERDHLKVGTSDVDVLARTFADLGSNFSNLHED